MDRLKFLNSSVAFTKEGVSGGKVGVTTYKLFVSLRVFKMDILEAINAIHFQEVQLQEAQNFLESCLSNDCFDSRFNEFLAELSIFNSEDLSSIKKNFKNLCQIFLDLLEMKHQIHATSLYLRDFVELHSPDDSDNVSLSGFDAELFCSYYESFIEAVTEYNLYLTEAINLYWVYFPVEIQDFVKNYLDNEKVHNEVIASQSLKFLSLEILDQYKSSVVALELSLSSIANRALCSPKLSLSQIKNITSEKLLNSPPSYSSSNTKSYTLGDVLDKITPENKHEAVEWGESGGREVW